MTTFKNIKLATEDTEKIKLTTNEHELTLIKLLLVCAVVLLLGGKVYAEKSISTLIEEATYQEETVGDVNAAITIYEKVIADDQARRPQVARATYGAGMCYLKKGDKDKAAQLFNDIVTKFADQKVFVIKAQKELAKIDPSAADSTPHVVRTSPAAFANNVDPSLDKITVTFNTQMMDKSWAWTGGGDTYPKSNGDIYYDPNMTICTMPVKLEPGKVYWVGINAPSFKSFQTKDGVPAKRYVILFATKSADGKPTPLPADMLGEAKAINAASTAPSPKVVSTFPVALANDVDPSLNKITVLFNTKMMDQSWSWVGGGDTYPKTTGKPFYDETKTLCTMPVKLEPGKVYWVGINAPSFKFFQTAGHEPAKRYVILFATKTADGKPTPLPDDLRTEAEAINGPATVIRPQNTSEWAQGLVEDFFKHNYRDITSRKTIEWGTPIIDANGGVSIGYKYEMVVWDKDKFLANQIFTFDKNGKYLKAEKVEGFPKPLGKVEVAPEDVSTKESVQKLVEKFFSRNWRDITSRKTIEWGEPDRDPNGNVSIRYKCEAVIWDKDKKIMNKVFTFDKNGQCISANDVEGAPAKAGLEKAKAAPK